MLFSYAVNRIKKNAKTTNSVILIWKMLKKYNINKTFKKQYFVVSKIDWI